MSSKGNNDVLRTAVPTLLTYCLVVNRRIGYSAICCAHAVRRYWLMTSWGAEWRSRQMVLCSSATLSHVTLVFTLAGRSTVSATTRAPSSWSLTVSDASCLSFPHWVCPKLLSDRSHSQWLIRIISGAKLSWSSQSQQYIHFRNQRTRTASNGVIMQYLEVGAPWRVQELETARGLGSMGPYFTHVTIFSRSSPHKNWISEVPTSTDYGLYGVPWRRCCLTKNKIQLNKFAQSSGMHLYWQHPVVTPIRQSVLSRSDRASGVQPQLTVSSASLVVVS